MTRPERAAAMMLVWMGLFLLVRFVAGEAAPRPGQLFMVAIVSSWWRPRALGFR